MRYLWLLSFFLISSCNSGEFSNINDYQRWLNDPSNGLVKETTVGSVSYSVKYLPPSYLAAKDFGEGLGVYDSLLDNYSRANCFLLTVKLVDMDKTVNTDINFKGIDNVEDYKRRIAELNFAGEEFIALNYNGAVISPIGVTYENTYGLKNSANLLAVFDTIAMKQNADLQFEFNDNFFGGGTLKFSFDTDKILATPKYKLN